MKDRLKAWLLLVLLAIPLACPLGCDGTGGSSVLTDAAAVQLETSLISSMNGVLTFIVYKTFNIPQQNITGLSGL
jgi:hypothetical protein